ncbi:MAG: hypothetical protein ACF8R9_08025 [Phycisphaerales bacterium JB054]
MPNAQCPSPQCPSPQCPSPQPLTPQDEHLLTALFDPDSNLIVAAAHVGLTEAQLIDWTTQPHIQHRITAQRALRRLREEIRAGVTARRTLEALEEIAHTAEDPIERRRAATAILRYLTPHQSRGRKHAEGVTTTPAPHSPPEPATTPAPTNLSHQSRGRKHAEGVTTTPAPNPSPEPTTTPAPTNLPHQSRGRKHAEGAQLPAASPRPFDAYSLPSSSRVPGTSCPVPNAASPVPHSPAHTHQPRSSNPIHTLLHAHAKTRQTPALAQPP